MTFSEALTQLILGKKIRRFDWDRNTCLCRVGESILEVYGYNQRTEPYSACSADMLAEDWEIAIEKVPSTCTITVPKDSFSWALSEMLKGKSITRATWKDGSYIYIKSGEVYCCSNDLASEESMMPYMQVSEMLTNNWAIFQK